MTRGDQRADEQAIRALIDQQVKGWAAGDPAAYASVFTADADYITFLGSHYTGRDAIAASYVPLFRRLLKGTRLLIDITEVRFLTPMSHWSTRTRRWSDGCDGVVGAMPV